jgi:hypothetical protein
MKLCAELVLSFIFLGRHRHSTLCPSSKARSRLNNLERKILNIELTEVGVLSINIISVMAL